jgi:histone-lysine N-methyltransferase SETMAR
MHRVAAKFVPHLLTDEQKANRVMVSQELFDRSNADEKLLKNVITGDETWVYGYDIETKAQSSPRPKKAHQSRSDVNVLLIVFSMGRTSFIMSLFHVVRQSMGSFTW